jgi:hypothetical protein
LDDLRALPEEYTSTPKQAIACGLANIHPIDGKTWPKAGSDAKYNAVFNCPTYTAYVRSIQPDGKLLVDLMRQDGADIANLLRQEGFAAPEAAPAAEGNKYLIIIFIYLVFGELLLFFRQQINYFHLCLR